MKLLFAISALLLLAASAHTQSAPGFTVSGRVVDALSGDPVREATVCLLPQNQEHCLARAQTDEEGGFSLRELAAGKFQLRAARHGYSSSYYEQHGNFNSAIVTGPGLQTDNLLFHLPPQAVLHGTVTDDAGDPVDAARVLLFRNTGTEETEKRIVLASSTTTDDIGSYEFADLPPGEYRLAVIAEPWYAMTAPGKNRPAAPELDVAYPVTYYDSTTDERAAQPLLLETGHRLEANLALHAVPAFNVQIAAPRARAGTNPPAELHQSIFGVDDASSLAGSAETSTPGQIEFFGIAPGHYELLAGSPPRIAAFDATSNGPVETSPAVETVRLSGKVESPSGDPLSDNLLLTLMSESTNSTPRELRILASDGRFQFPLLPVGQWKIKLTDGYDHALRVDGVVAAGRKRSGSRFSAEAGQPLDLAVVASKGSASLTGYVRQDGQGRAGAMVVLIPSDLRDDPSLVRRDQSDSDGSFLLTDIFPGQYTLVALEDAWSLDWQDKETISRFLPGGTTVTVSAGKRETLRLETPLRPQSRSGARP